MIQLKKSNNCQRRCSYEKTRTYIFDALVNLIAQSVLFFIGMFVWINPVYEVIWALAAAGFAAFLAFMERGAEKRSGADFRHYLMFSVLPVNIIALIVAAVRGAAEYKHGARERLSTFIIRYTL